jgi:hypothetical protein
VQSGSSIAHSRRSRITASYCAKSQSRLNRSPVILSAKVKLAACRGAPGSSKGNPPSSSNCSPSESIDYRVETANDVDRPRNYDGHDPFWVP